MLASLLQIGSVFITKYVEISYQDLIEYADNKANLKKTLKPTCTYYIFIHKTPDLV